MGWLKDIISFVKNPVGSFLKISELQGQILGGTISNVVNTTVSMNNNQSFWESTVESVTDYFSNKTNAQAGSNIATAQVNAVAGVVKSLALIAGVFIAVVIIFKSLFKK